MDTTITSVDTYISHFDDNVQSILRAVRTAIKEVAPDAVESISYGMPAYKHKGKPIAYFAAFARHIGFYATPNAHEQFAERLSAYKQGKGSVQFPINQPMPLELIGDMVRFNYHAIKD